MSADAFAVFDPALIEAQDRALTPREVLLRQFAGEELERLPAMPITMQFAARVAGVRYGDYARDHRVLVRAQEMVAKRFGFDHVSCISDPAREASDLGATIEWFDDQPPAIDESRALLSDMDVLQGLRVVDPHEGPRMSDRVKAAAALAAGVGKERLVEGWVEGPCAEGADLRGINAIMLDFYEAPDFVDELFDFTVRQGIVFAQAQIEAGVDIVGIGDAAASLVGPDLYARSVFPAERRLIDAIHAMGGLVRLHICGNIGHSLELIGQVGADMVDIDYPVSVEDARTAMGPSQVLLGNLDPVRELMNATLPRVLELLAQKHSQARPRYVVGAGCEIPVGTPHENVEAMVAYARATRP